MSSQQQTLGGEIVERDWHAPKNGAALVLWYSSPDTSFERMGAWYTRLQEEGLL